MYKFLVLGTGVGSAIAHALKKFCGDTEVTIADVSLSTACQAAINIECSAKIYKVGDNFEFWRDFDVVISALPAKYNIELARNAINTNVHFCDLGGIVDITRQQLSLAEEFPDYKKSIVPDCGLMPGLGIMLARDIINNRDKTETVEILVGGLPKKPQPPINYQITFSPEGLKHLCYDPVPILKNGEIVYMPPFSDHRISNLPIMYPYHSVESFISSGASLAAESFQKLGVKNFCERTLRWPGFIETFKSLPVEEFEKFVEDNVPVTNKDNPDLVYMEVHVDDDWSKVRVDDYLDGFSSMQRATGYPTALIAYMLAEGCGKPGVHLPENIFDEKGLRSYIDRVCTVI